jgi:hypothetical protein
MSRSDGLPSSRIEVAAPLGTAITVNDGGFSTVAQATTRLARDLPDGVYTLSLSEGDLVRQWTIRLRAGRTWRYPEDVRSAEGTGAEREDPLRNAGRETLAQRLAGLSCRGTEIVVVVGSSDFDATAALARSIRLRGAGRIDRGPERVQLLPGGRTLVRYLVEPGAHRLGFESFERKRLEQAVHAFEGRRTVVLMEYGQASIVEKVKGAARIRKRRGIDPGRTVVISQDGSATAEDIADQMRLAGILLYLLRTRVAVADVGIALALTDGQVDPYLRLYAAVASIALPGTILQRLATSVEKDQDLEQLQAEAAARDLHVHLECLNDWPDATCLGWRLGRGPDATLADIPMLEVAWRWASSRSAREGGRSAITSRTLADAALADAGASPWLVVTPAAASAVYIAEDEPEDILPELTLVAEKVARALKANDAIGPGSTPGNETSAFLDAAWLTPPTERLVQAIVQAGGTERWASGDPALLPQLAASLGEPLAALARTIKTASRELRELLERAAANPDNIWNSDPHKGGFGSSPECRGARLQIELVTERDDFESLELELVVAAGKRAKPIQGPVTFHLHPTFSPSLETVQVIDGVARFSFHAWGAFTVGVTTADGRTMELDLAQEAVLPEWFRAN